MKTFSFENSKVKMKILAFFLDNPSKEFYESEVRKRIGVSSGSANRYLKELAREGILVMSKKGAMNFFMLDAGSTLAKKLKVARSFSMPVTQEIKKLGKDLGVKIYLYGSVARGEDTEKSDWDLLVIGEAKMDALERGIRPLEQKFRREIKALLLTKRDWARMKAKDPAFYERAEKDRIEIA